MKEIVAHGPVVIIEGKLLVTKDDKDDFYKIPGGRGKEGETGEETCIRRVGEETGMEVEIVKELSTMR